MKSNDGKAAVKVYALAEVNQLRSELGRDPLTMDRLETWELWNTPEQNQRMEASFRTERNLYEARRSAAQAFDDLIRALHRLIPLESDVVGERQRVEAFRDLVDERAPFLRGPAGDAFSSLEAPRPPPTMTEARLLLEQFRFETSGPWWHGRVPNERELALVWVLSGLPFEIKSNIEPKRDERGYPARTLHRLTELVRTTRNQIVEAERDFAGGMKKPEARKRGRKKIVIRKNALRRK